MMVKDMDPSIEESNVVLDTTQSEEVPILQVEESPSIETI